MRADHHRGLLGSLWGYLLTARLSLDLRTREILINRTSARLGCDYVFGAHVAGWGRRAGFTDQQLRSLAHGRGDDPCWTLNRDRITIRVVDELCATATLGDATWHEASAEFSDEQLLDLLVMVGWYHALCYVARAAQVPLEPHTPTLDSVG